MEVSDEEDSYSNYLDGISRSDRNLYGGNSDKEVGWTKVYRSCPYARNTNPESSTNGKRYGWLSILHVTPEDNSS